MSQTTIAIIGLGIMGRGIAKNLQKAGFTLQLFCRESQKGLELQGENIMTSSSLAQVLAGADFIVFCLTNDEVIEEIFFDGIQANLHAGMSILDFGTTSHTLTKKLYKECQKRAVHFVDCPMTGSKNAADSGELVIMVGAEKDELEPYQKIFDACAKKIIACGGLGQGQLAKQSLNLVQAGMLQMYIEGLILAKKTGVSEEVYREVIRSSAGNSALAEFKLEQICNQDYSTHFSVKNMNKDLNHVLNLAIEYEVTLPLGFSLKPIFDAALNYKLAEKDFASIAKVNYYMNQVEN